MTESYITLEAAFRFEPERVKGSRFIADLAPVDSAQAAQAFVESIRAEFPDASHHCYAWSIGEQGHETRSNDDGEPSGSAGRPILAQIEGHDVTGVVCVVTRYFGGTKLGVGGLMRAYGGAAGKALDRAPLVTKVVTERWQVEYPYECSGPVEGLLHGLALKLEEPQYGAASVTGWVTLPKGSVPEFTREWLEKTGGRGQMGQE